MSGSTQTPSLSASSTSESSLEPGLLMRQPLMWLLVILLLALGLRAWRMTETLERDEFGALYAIAQRKTVTPDEPVTAADPLRPVSGLGEVSERSVLPFGIRNPIPLYHDILYFFVKALPIAEWSLRLPSLLAGIGCVLGIYFLCRQLGDVLGIEMALVAALFVAVEPIQIVTSTLARPYALGNLACVLSFVALLAILTGRPSSKTSARATSALTATGYGVTVAFMGYMNPVLLLVVLAHAGLVVYWVVSHRNEESPSSPSSKAVHAGAGFVLAIVLLAPEYGYFAKVHEFASSHRNHLLRFYPVELKAFLLHNSTFLAGLLVAWIAGLIIRYQMQGGGDELGELGDPSAEGQESKGAVPATKVAQSAGPEPSLPYAASRAGEVAPAVAAVALGDEAAAAQPSLAEPPPPDNPDLIWVGRLWLFLPQLVALVLAYAAGEAIFFSKYLSYTTLGAMLVLAYWVTRGPTHQIRLGVSAAVAVAVFAMYFIPSWGHGHRLSEPSHAEQLVAGLSDAKSSKPGDIILLRTGLIEADFLDQAPAERSPSRRHLAGALAAPWTTLYVPVEAKPFRVVVLSTSHNSDFPFPGAPGSNARARAGAADLFEPQRFYTPELAAELRKLGDPPGQFWVVNDDVPHFAQFLTCFLPWLADAVESDLRVARNRSDEKGGRHFIVQTDSRPKDFLDGLSNVQATDFTPRLIRVERQHPPRPPLVTKLSLAAFAALPQTNAGTAVAAAWLTFQDRAPRLLSPQER